MTDAHEMLPALKAAYRHWNETKGGDTSQWLALMADHVDLRSLADGGSGLPFTVPAHTRPQVIAYLNGIAETFDMDFYEVDRFVAEGDTIVAIGRCQWRVKATGKIFASPILTVWRFEGGKAVAFHEFYDTAAAAKAVAG